MRTFLYAIVHSFYAIIAALAVGAVLNLIMLFLLAFLFAGSDGDKWVRFYFGSDGVYFVSGVVVVACCAYPFTRKLNIVKGS